MPMLTDELLRSAEPLLEEYRAALFDVGEYGCAMLEHRLRAVWAVGYQSIGSLMIDLSEHGRYQEVAAFYMEYSDPTGVTAEFKAALARLYGVRSYDHSRNREARRIQFWETAFAGND